MASRAKRAMGVKLSHMSAGSVADHSINLEPGIGIWQSFQQFGGGAVLMGIGGLRSVSQNKTDLLRRFLVTSSENPAFCPVQTPLASLLPYGVHLRIEKYFQISLFHDLDSTAARVYT